MAFSALCEDEQRILFGQLCNTLEPRVAVDFGSASGELRALTEALLQQLRADHEVAAALCRFLLGRYPCPRRGAWTGVRGYTLTRRKPSCRHWCRHWQAG